MTGKFNLYRIYKRWTANDQSQVNTQESTTFDLQTTNLLPIFNTNTNLFTSVMFKSRDQSRHDSITDLVQGCLKNINYWQCHGRAIRCILPTHYSELISEVTIKQIEDLLINSRVSVGLIAVAIKDLDEKIFPLIETKLIRLRRLGVDFEILSDFNSINQYNFLPNSIFNGFHLPISAIRHAYQDEKYLSQLNQWIEKLNTHNFHKYCGDIGLVHDFIFAKNIGIDFCYGPLMMNAVSEHQILKIKESQFANLKIDPTPSLHLHDGEHR